jgi:E3 SUMO-protein ligase RanBP2
VSFAGLAAQHNAGAAPGWGKSTATSSSSAGSTAASAAPIQPLFGKASSAATADGEGGEGGDDDAVEGADADVYFEPLVKLEKVAVVTGEEDETVLHEVRTRLFRWGVGNEGEQWKERGVGSVRLMQHKTTGQLRLLMRRDTVHKVCLNHRVLAELKLAVDAADGRVLKWVANEMSDEDVEATVHKFSARFKSAEVAAAFKAAVEKAQAGASTAATAAGATPATAAAGATLAAAATAAPAAAADPSAAAKPAAGMNAFAKAKAAGTWNCGDCMCENKAEDVKCPACGATQPGKEAEAVKLAQAAKPAAAVSAFKFGSGPAAAALASSAATAVPPALRISSTTCAAGPSS